MNLDALLNLFNYCLILIYGVLLSIDMSGGWKSKRDKSLTAVIIAVLLAMQGICDLWLGDTFTAQIYPLITHVPLILFLHYLFKHSIGVSIVSVLTAYLCCQIPEWIASMVRYNVNSDLTAELSYTAAILVSFILLHKYLVKPASEVINYSTSSLLGMGSLPAMYYIFDYYATVYTNLLYSGIIPVIEFIPTMTVLSYIIFVSMYHKILEKRYTAELESAHLQMELKQSGEELSMLQHSIEETATYRHDMRHHFLILGEYIQLGETDKALEYIRAGQKDLERLTPTRYCKNRAVNLIISHFAARAERARIELEASVSLPEKLMLSETELCTLLSNALENAIGAASECPDGSRWVRIDIRTHMNNLLISVENPYSGEVKIENNIPITSRPGHGFGVKSIHSITERHKGICTFTAENGTFALRVILKLS